MKNLLIAVLMASVFVGCAKDSGQSTLVGSWTKVSAAGQDCDGTDAAFNETRSFGADGITSDSVTTVPFTQGGVVTKQLNGRVYSQLTLSFSNQERMVSYSGDSGMTLQANAVKECFYTYKKN